MHKSIARFLSISFETVSNAFGLLPISLINNSRKENPFPFSFLKIAHHPLSLLFSTGPVPLFESISNPWQIHFKSLWKFPLNSLPYKGKSILHSPFSFPNWPSQTNLAPFFPPHPIGPTGSRRPMVLVPARPSTRTGLAMPPLLRTGPSRKAQLVAHLGQQPVTNPKP